MKKVLIALLVILIIIQLIRPGKNIAAQPSSNDIALKYNVPGNVKQILQRSCYDCHSNNTDYPWYSNIQPVMWFLDNHIQEGKRELNFSEFASYTPKKAAHKLDEVISETGEHEMPISSYLWMHKNAKLSDTEIEQITKWASTLSDSIRKANNLPAGK